MVVVTISVNVLEPSKQTVDHLAPRKLNMKYAHNRTKVVWKCWRTTDDWQTLDVNRQQTMPILYAPWVPQALGSLRVKISNKITQ